VVASLLDSVGVAGRSVAEVWEELLDCSAIWSESNEGGDDMVMYLMMFRG